MNALDTPVLELSLLSKRFGGVQALSDVSLTIHPGEVHGLVGENGSGKSTLVKILAGYHAPDGGELVIHGEQVKLPLYPGQFRDLGMSFVHQERVLIPSLSVAENFMLGELAGAARRSRWGRWSISWDRERQRVADLLARYNVSVDPRAIVSSLSSVDRAMLAVVRAVDELRSTSANVKSHLLILDEPSAYLPATDTEQLLTLIREVVGAGASVLFVSHDLDEVMEVTNRVTVLRDGHAVGTVVTQLVTQAQLIEMIVGQRISTASLTLPRGREPKIPTIVGDRISGGALRDVSFELFSGELLGVTGLSGSGFGDLCYALVGALPGVRGKLTIGGVAHDLARMSPGRALREGVTLLPGERQHQGAILSLPVVDNVTMPVLDKYFRHLLLHRREMLLDVMKLNDRFDVRPNHPLLPYSALSGGNQQKALVGKWLQGHPRLVLLHEPTAGVDVGARRKIFHILRDAVAAGTHVICASSDYDELATICDRILIIRRGKVSAELTGPEIPKQSISLRVLSEEGLGGPEVASLEA